MTKALLVGSGFSKNFGGYLPKDICTEIFNHKDTNSKLRNHLVSNFLEHYDFEGFYQNVMDSKNNKFSQNEKLSIKNILTGVYKDMDDCFIHSLDNIKASFSYLAALNFLINSFSSAEGDSGYIFSLNQDLLLERLCANYLKKLNFYKPNGWDGEAQGLLLPYYGPVNSPFYKYHKNDDRPDLNFNNLEDAIDQDTIEQWEKKNSRTFESNSRKAPCLIKLHGSYYWETNSKKEKLWVVGGEKTSKIQSHPLLACYFNKFKHVLTNTKNLDLYIIGYGFCDDHINDVIKHSCENGARLIIIDIMDLKSWLHSVFNKKMGATYVESIRAYHSKTFSELFPLKNSEDNFMFDGDLNSSHNLLKGFRSNILL